MACYSTQHTKTLISLFALGLQVTGSITYNGRGFDEFRSAHTAAYVDQHDLHQPELTVRETLDFAARCQGVGSKAGMAPMSHALDFSEAASSLYFSPVAAATLLMRRNSVQHLDQSSRYIFWQKGKLL